VLHAAEGKAKLASSGALANLFGLFAGQIECVLLNACYSKVQAEAIYRHVDCVIGMNQAVGDSLESLRAIARDPSSGTLTSPRASPAHS
jgi:hypothetical protein